MARQRVGLGAADQHRRGSPRTDLFNGETKAKGYYVADGAGPYLQVSAQRQQVMGVPVQARRQGPRHGPKAPHRVPLCRRAVAIVKNRRQSSISSSQKVSSVVCRSRVRCKPSQTAHCYSITAANSGLRPSCPTPGVTLFGRAEPQLGQNEVPGLDAHQCRALAY